MSDEPINGNHLQLVTPEPEPTIPGQSTVIVTVSVALELGADAFEITLRDPGIVRAVTFWMKQPKVIASAMRDIQPVPLPMLFIECDPAGEKRRRRFVFSPSDRPIKPPAGERVVYVATAIRGDIAGHLFEILEVPS